MPGCTVAGLESELYIYNFYLLKQDAIIKIHLLVMKYFILFKD